MHWCVPIGHFCARGGRRLAENASRSERPSKYGHNTQANVQFPQYSIPPKTDQVPKSSEVLHAKETRRQVVWRPCWLDEMVEIAHPGISVAVPCDFPVTQLGAIEMCV